MHPIIDITANEAPVLADSGGWQFTGSGKLIDGGWWDPKELSHFDHGENVLFPSIGLLSLDDWGC